MKNILIIGANGSLARAVIATAERNPALRLTLFYPQHPAPCRQAPRHHRRRAQSCQPAKRHAGAGHCVRQFGRRFGSDGRKYRCRDASRWRAPRDCRVFHRHLQNSAARSAAPLPM